MCHDSQQGIGKLGTGTRVVSTAVHAFALLFFWKKVDAFNIKRGC